MNNDARRIIARAADIVEQEPGLRVNTALNRACEEFDYVIGDVIYNPIHDDIEHHLWKYCGHKRHVDAYVSIGAWNDAPGRTQAEVVAVLRAVAGGE